MCIPTHYATHRCHLVSLRVRSDDSYPRNIVRLSRVLWVAALHRGMPSKTISDSNMPRDSDKLSHGVRHRKGEGLDTRYRRPIETPYGAFESIIAAAQYTSEAPNAIRDRLKRRKPGWRYITA